MNIFVLACAAANAANLHCDQHVCKMIIETAQMLYTYLHSIGELARLDLKSPVTGDALAPYKPTHKHHPCVLWLHGGRSHFRWLLDLGLSLCNRYSDIYDKTHSTAEHLFALDTWVCPDRLPDDCWPAEWLRRLVALGVKRLHDFGKPGIFAVALFIPMVSILAFIVLCLYPGDAGANEYGDRTNAPKQ